MTAREVARHCFLVARSVANKGPQAGYMPSHAEDGSGRWVLSRVTMAARLDALSSVVWP